MAIGFDFERASLSRIIWEYMGVMSLVDTTATTAYDGEDLGLLQLAAAEKVGTLVAHTRNIADLLRRKFLPIRKRTDERVLQYVDARTNNDYWGVLTGPRLPDHILPRFRNARYTELFAGKRPSRQKRKEIEAAQRTLARALAEYRSGSRPSLRGALGEREVNLEGWFPVKYSGGTDLIKAVWARRKRGQRGVKKIARLAVIADYEYDELYRASRMLVPGKQLTLSQIAEATHNAKLAEIARKWSSRPFKKYKDEPPEIEVLANHLLEKIELTDWIGVLFEAPSVKAAYEVFRFLEDNVGRWGYTIKEKNGRVDYYQDPDKPVNRLKLKLRPMHSKDYIEVVVTSTESLLYDEFGPNAHHLYEKRQKDELTAIFQGSPSSKEVYVRFVKRGMQPLQGIAHAPLFEGNNH